MVGVDGRLLRCGLRCAVDRIAPAVGASKVVAFVVAGQMLEALAFDQVGLMG
jgi:uncharacterized membrane protein YdcZ (DUF606 family)